MFPIIAVVVGAAKVREPCVSGFMRTDSIRWGAQSFWSSERAYVLYIPIPVVEIQSTDHEAIANLVFIVRSIHPCALQDL